MRLLIKHLIATNFRPSESCSLAMQKVMRTLACSILLLSIIAAQAQKAIPQLWGTRVHDEAKILKQETVDNLENELTNYEDSTSNQIAIVTVSSLDGEPIENYSLRVAEEWKLGRKDNDNGVLLVIAVDDHKIRIEVGYGLEGVLTDALCSRIIRNELAPAFRQDKYDEGVTNAVHAIVGAIGGEYASEDSDQIELGILPRILIGLFVFSILGTFTFLALIIPGCGSWFLYVFLIPFYAVFPLVVLNPPIAQTVGVIYLVGFPILKLISKNSGWRKKLEKKMGKSSGRGGGWSSGSGWSRSGSSGGFSGGGGSFGGGGSSGSW